MSEELELLSNSFQSLKAILSKFVSAKENVQQLSKLNNEKKSLLVPLTSSLYVPGTLANHDTVIVDIGTGYYVSKSLKDAIDYYSRKSAYLQKNIEEIQQNLLKKQYSMQVLLDIIAEKSKTQK